MSYHKPLQPSEVSWIIEGKIRGLIPLSPTKPALPKPDGDTTKKSEVIKPPQP